MANAKIGNPLYQLPVWETITTAWEKVYGSKGTIWAGLGIIILISIGFGMLENLTKNIGPVYGLLCLIGSVVCYFLEFGLLFIGIRRAFDLPIEWKMIFRVITDFQLALWVVCAYLLMFVIYIPALLVVGLGVFFLAASQALGILCIILGILMFIFLGMRMILTMGFVLDTGMNAIDAVKASFKATRSNVLPILGVLIVQAIIIIISAIPLGIGLVWTIPLSLIIYGLMYQRLQVNLR